MDKRFDDSVVPLTNPSQMTFVPVDLTKQCGANMKGFALMHLFHIMEQVDPSYPEQWRQMIPERQRSSVEKRAITSTAWLPMEFYFHGVNWLAEKMGNAPRAAIDVGCQIAARDIGSFFRFVMSMASPATVLMLSGRFWRSYFDQSSMQATLDGNNGALCEVRDWPLRDETSPHEMAGSMVAWIEASRAKDVRISRLEVTAPGHFTFAVRWR